jgi:predicted transcriptional regulator
MGLIEREVKAYECPSCGSLTRHEEVQCCGESRELVDTSVEYEPPEAEPVVKTVFGISSTELVICNALMAEGDATIDDLTSQVSRDRSAIQRHINHLTELGIVAKKSRVLDEGGRIHVYSSVPVDEIYRTLHLGVYAWLNDAEDLLDELTREKLEAMAEQADEIKGDGLESNSLGELRNSLFERLLKR